MSQLEKRIQIRTLYLAKKHTPFHISRSLGVATVRRVIKSLKNEEKLEHKTGIANSVAQQIRRDDTCSVREIASKLHEIGKPASKSTVHRCLVNLRYDKKCSHLVPILSEVSCYFQL